MKDEYMSPNKRMALQLAFDEKEIPVSDLDVRRIGGESFYGTEETDSQQVRTE